MSSSMTCLLFCSALLLGACAAQNSPVLPVESERAEVEDNYKQCISEATAKLMSVERSADVIVRGAMEQCSELRHSMLSTYPERWRATYAQRLDAQVYQYQLSLMREKPREPLNKPLK